MRLALLSDIHLEFYDENRHRKFLKEFNSLDVDYLVIAGDIHPNKEFRDNFLSQINVPTLTVMGNHDFYGSTVYDDFWENENFVGACLWSNFRENVFSERVAYSSITDFHQIKGVSQFVQNWTTTDCKTLHYKQKAKIFESNAEIVITHFAPCVQSTAERYQNSFLNDYFVNDMEEAIRTSNKKLWIHGHTHSNHDYNIGKCRVISQQYGYPGEMKKYGESKDIKIIEI